MMKVCFYSGIFARSGGIEEFTKDLTLSLLESGVQVEVVCAALKHPILDDIKAAGATVIRIPVYWGCRWNIPDYALFLPALFRVEKADIVIHRKPLVPWFYRFLSRKPQHIYITGYRPKEQFPDAELRARFFSAFDRVYTQTNQFKQDLDDCGIGCPVEVIPHIPPAVYTAGKRTAECSTLRVGILGRLEGQKNHAYALEVLGLLSTQLPAGFNAVEFHIHGTGSLESEIQQKATEYDYTTVFHGKYNRSDLPKLVVDYDLFLITSISEGQCIVALEILAGGRPLFATPVGALPEILEDERRGCLVPQEAAEEAVQCILKWWGLQGSLSPEDIQESYLIDYNRNQIKKHYVERLRQAVI